MDTFLRYLNGFEKRARSERKYIAFNKETNYEQGIYIVNTNTFLATDAYGASFLFVWAILLMRLLRSSFCVFQRRT